MLIELKTNATKRNPDHRIKVEHSEIFRTVLPKFVKLPKGWKVVDASNIKPGLKLHYHICKDGLVRVSFEEKGEGVAKDCDWYTDSELAELVLNTLQI